MSFTDAVFHAVLWGRVPFIVGCVTMGKYQSDMRVYSYTYFLVSTRLVENNKGSWLRKHPRLCQSAGEQLLVSPMLLHIGGLPLNTWRNNNVVLTSKRRYFDVITSKWRHFDVITTSLLRNVSAGLEPGQHEAWPWPYLTERTLLPHKA